MRIAEIRATIDTLNWNRMDATGGTRNENQRCDLPARLAPHLAAVMLLQIPPRFTRDIESRQNAIDAAHTVLKRWALSQLPQPTVNFKESC